MYDIFMHLNLPKYAENSGWYYIETDVNKNFSGYCYYLHSDGLLHDSVFGNIVNDFGGYFPSYKCAIVARKMYYDAHGKVDEYTYGDATHGSRELDLNE